MNFFGPNQVTGDQFRLAQTDPRHFAGKHDPKSAESSSNFGDMLVGSLTDVSNLEKEHNRLAVQAVANPESVNPHDVTIAAAKANMALSITKNVVDRVIRAYQDIINMR